MGKLMDAVPKVKNDSFKEIEKCYSVKVLCPNCRKWITLEIPLGKRLIDFLKENTCENCGCTFVKKLSDFRELLILGGKD